MVLPIELFAPVMVFLRIFGFAVSLTGLRQHIGASNVFTLSIAITFGAFAYGRNIQMPQTSGGMDSYILAGLLEILLGFCMSIPFSIAISSISSSGRIVDLLRGNLIAEQLVPGFEERASAFEKLLSLGLLAGLFSSGLWTVPLNVFYKSFSLPAGALLSSFANPYELLSFAQVCLRECLWFLAPVMILLFALDTISLGLTRAAPKLSLQSELAGAKLILGLLFLSLLDWGVELGPKLLQGALSTMGLS